LHVEFFDFLLQNAAVGAAEGQISGAPQCFKNLWQFTTIRDNRKCLRLGKMDMGEEIVV